MNNLSCKIKLFNSVTGQYTNDTLFFNPLNVSHVEVLGDYDGLMIIHIGNSNYFVKASDMQDLIDGTVRKHL